MLLVLLVLLAAGRGTEVGLGWVCRMAAMPAMGTFGDRTTKARTMYSLKLPTLH
eukprot:COSAG02_NODE_26537_length_622_cov_15.610169_1_plen_53_part_10